LDPSADAKGHKSVRKTLLINSQASQMAGAKSAPNCASVGLEGIVSIALPVARCAAQNKESGKSCGAARVNGGLGPLTIGALFVASVVAEERSADSLPTGQMRERWHLGSMGTDASIWRLLRPSYKGDCARARASSVGTDGLIVAATDVE